DAGWAAAEDQPRGAARRDLRHGRVVGKQLAVDAALPHAARDELAVLGPEIQDQHLLGRSGLHEGLTDDGRRMKVGAWCSRANPGPCYPLIRLPRRAARPKLLRRPA